DIMCCCVDHFFFQAEDGIRDPLVTGVQTCALPISDNVVSITLSSNFGKSPSVKSFLCILGTNKLRRLTRSPFIIPCTNSVSVTRSEERRVGKECRYWC